MNILSRAIAIATFAHDGQLDKGGQPYIFHPLRVAMSPLLTTEEQRVVAVLHDVIEDTDITALRLIEEGFSSEIVDAVLSVTKIEGELYTDFIKRVSWNPIGRIVKLADIEDNTRWDRLEYLPKEQQEYLLEKYGKAKRFLEDA